MEDRSDIYEQQQQQRVQQRGILPPTLLSALDRLVDRLNSTVTVSVLTSVTHSLSPSIRALLVGTNEGVGLSRSFGSTAPSTMSEDVLTSVETVWATLPSSCPPHVIMAASDQEQPPHPLLKPIGLGDEIHTVFAFCHNCALVHLHMSPLVVTFIATPTANLGGIRSFAIPVLKTLLEPVRLAILVPRREAATNNNDNKYERQRNQQHQQRLEDVGDSSGIMADYYQR